MTLTDWQIAAEPREQDYETLIRLVSERSERFGFFLTGMELDTGALELLERLAPFLVATNLTTETPESRLLAPVTENWYVTNPRAIDLVAAATDRLYDWQEPHLPNDLVFLRRGSHRPLLTILADEREAFLSLSATELKELAAACPSLAFKSVP
jgi:hypothetical protein